MGSVEFITSSVLKIRNCCIDDELKMFDGRGPPIDVMLGRDATMVTDEVSIQAFLQLLNQEVGCAVQLYRYP